MWGRWVATGRAARVVAHFSRLFLTSFARRALMPFQDDNRPKFFAHGHGRGGVSSGGAGVGWGGGAFVGFVRLRDWRWRSFQFFPPSFVHLALPSVGPEAHKVLYAKSCCQVFGASVLLGEADALAGLAFSSRIISLAPSALLGHARVLTSLPCQPTSSVLASLFSQVMLGGSCP